MQAGDSVSRSQPGQATLEHDSLRAGSTGFTDQLFRLTVQTPRLCYIAMPKHCTEIPKRLRHGEQQSIYEPPHPVTASYRLKPKNTPS